MLYLVTGVPGASKTAFVVMELDKIERENQVNLRKNVLIYQHNLPLFERYKQDFSYYEIEKGSGHLLRTELEILDDDYFDMLGKEYDDLRPDDYFMRSVRYNQIIERISDREGDQGFKLFLPVRTIYTNINALKIPYVRSNVYDWRTCPDGSLIVIDEVQLVLPYSEVKDKDNTIIRDLTIHRHRGFDFYFITQSPAFLHPTIKDLIACHFHITRPYGLKPKVYRYGSFRPYPSTFTNKLHCEDKFTISVPQRIFSLYKSTTINTHKFRLPKFAVILAIISMSLLLGFLYMLNKNKGGVYGDILRQSDFVKHEGKREDKADEKVSKEALSTQERLEADSETKAETQDQATIKEPSSHSEERLQIVGCIEQDNRCQCYHSQGGIIRMKHSECQEYMKGYKPYYAGFSNVQSENRQVKAIEPIESKPQDQTNSYVQGEGYTIVRPIN